MHYSEPIAGKRFPSFSLLFLLFLCFAATMSARQSWTFSADSGPYTDLKESTPLKPRPGAFYSDTLFAVDLNGETFNLYGEQYRCDESTPLVIYGGGFIRFDNSNNAVVIDGFLSFLEEFDADSRVSYAIEQTEGEKVLKVEWKRMAVIDSPEVAQDYVNFQVWVHQKSGVVELRYGANTVNYQPGATIGGGPYMGIFQFLEVPTFKILEKNWLIGDVTAPEYDTTTQTFYLIEGVPAEGTIFRFTPKVVAGVGSQPEKGVGEYHIFPNPTTGTMTLKAPEPLRRDGSVRLMDVLGRTVSETRMPAATSALELDLPRPGVYYCEITGENGSHLYSVICQ